MGVQQKPIWMYQRITIEVGLYGTTNRETTRIAPMGRIVSVVILVESSQ
jgi:hypothetical protein